MTAIFDGLTGYLNAVFGAPVTHTPAGGPAAVLTGVFREEPAEEPVGDGRGRATLVPTLRLRRQDAAGVLRGSRIAPAVAPGRAFVVLDPVGGTSPAADAYVLFTLEEVAP